MNVVYLKGNRKTVIQSFGPIKLTAYIIGGLLTIALSPVIALVCFVNQFRCEHIWIPIGSSKNSCVKCNKKEPRKELLGLERL